MEERIVDDEFGRGVRIKKTKDGNVDVIDALADETEEEVVEELELILPETETEEEKTESYVVAHVYDDEDDEDLIGLSPEEAARVRAEKAEAARLKKEAYENACRVGNELLDNGSFHAAELAFEKALQLDEIATEASVGYWRAKTMNFSDPDILIGEYVEEEEELEDLESDLGMEAAYIIKREYRAPFEKRLQELKDQEAPLSAALEEKKASRKEVIKPRLVRSGCLFLLSSLVFIGVLVATLMIGLKINTVPDNRYVMPTIVLGCVSMAAFILDLIFSNKIFNDLRIYRMNERLSSTEEGRLLLEIRSYREMYEGFLYIAEENEEDEETTEE